MLRLGATTVTVSALVWLTGAVIALLALRLGLSLRRAAEARRLAAAQTAQQALALEAQMAGLLKAQAEMQGRLGAMADVFGARQAELTQSIGQRLDAMTGRIGHDDERADPLHA